MPSIAEYFLRLASDPAACKNHSHENMADDQMRNFGLTPDQIEWVKSNKPDVIMAHWHEHESVNVDLSYDVGRGLYLVALQTVVKPPTSPGPTSVKKGGRRSVVRRSRGRRSGA